MTLAASLVVGVIGCVCLWVLAALAACWWVYRCPLCHRSWWPHRDRHEMLSLMRDQRSGKNVVVHRYCQPFLGRPRTVLSPKSWRAER